MTWRLSYNHWPIVQGHQNNKTRDTHHKRHNIYTILNNTENWITLTSIKTRGEISYPIANTRVNHSKKAKLNIMHVTVNFLELFFRTGKIFFGLTRFSCLSVRMTDNFSASFGKSVSGEATNTNVIFFCLTRPQFVPTIYHTRGEHANHYATDVVPYFYFLFIIFLIKISYCPSLYYLKTKINPKQ